MAKRTLIITGDRKVTRMLNALGSTRARAIHRKAIRKAARPVLQEAKGKSPVRTGALRKSLTVRATRRSRKSIGVTVTQKEGMFKGDEFYGGFQEFGWRLGKRKSKRSRMGSKDTRRKIPGKWFMRAAGTATEDEAINIYESEVLNLIESEARK